MRAIIFIGLLFSYSYLVDCYEFYITPNHGNCTVNAAYFSPCYTLNQVIRDEVLRWKNYARLYLLPGTHVIPKNQTLHGYSLNGTALYPWNHDHHRWNEQEQVVIEYELNAGLHFYSMSEVHIYSVHFAYCTLQFDFEYKTFDYTTFRMGNSIIMQ